MNRLSAMARFVAANPHFLAFALEDYAVSEGINEETLCERLGCPPETYPALALCTHPRPERFMEDCEAIAARFGVDAGFIAEVVRRSDALQAVRQGENASTLMAARDREEER